jgi:hypothetical protein
MVERKIQLKDVNGVSAGRTALIVCPRPWRYHMIALTLGDTAVGNGNAPAVSAIVNEIRLNYFNGIQRRATGAQIDAINLGMSQDGLTQYGSSAAISGGANGTGRTILPIFLREPWRKRSADSDALAWQTGFFSAADKLIVEVDLVAGITPVLTACAIVDDFNAGRPHPIMKWDKNDAPAVGTPIEFNKLDRRDAYAQLSIFDTSDAKTIDRIRIVQASTEIHDLTKQENAELLRGNDMNPEAGVYHVVFDLDDDLSSVVPAQGLQLTATPSAAANGTMPIVTQRIGLPE